jgi:hypothetical protein
MAQRFARIPIITENTTDTVNLIDIVNARIDEINRVFQEVEIEQSKAKGDDTNNPTFNNSLDLQSNQIKNVARSRDPGDVVTRRELEEVGILGNRADGISLKGDLTVDGTITLNGPSGGGAEVPTGDDVADAIDTAIEANMATSNDGNRWDREDAAGIDGSTSGTVAMAVDGQGKTRPIEIRNGNLPVQDLELRTLLSLLNDNMLTLIEEVRKLN